MQICAQKILICVHKVLIWGFYQFDTYKIILLTYVFMFFHILNKSKKDFNYHSLNPFLYICRQFSVNETFHQKKNCESDSNLKKWWLNIDLVSSVPQFQKLLETLFVKQLENVVGKYIKPTAIWVLHEQVFDSDGFYRKYIC